jgi:hypothetical protein
MSFEKSSATFVPVGTAVALSSGMDMLRLSKSLDEADESCVSILLLSVT